MSSSSDFVSHDHAARNATFHTTRWSVVVAAGKESRPALESLCQSYWHPLYAYVRRTGRDHEVARDLTQGFFARLLEKRDLVQADAARGRFRAFLLASLKNYVANEWDRERTEKRGGGAPIVSIDEHLEAIDPADGANPERAFERAWALCVLERALSRLRDEQAHAGKSRMFAALEPLLTASDDLRNRAELARELDVTENALKVALHRLRRRYGELLRDEVAGTLSDPLEVDAEIRALCAALGR